MDHDLTSCFVININDKDQHPLMWMARRSKSKSKYPSMLDHIVAGGQPAGLSLMENAIKECEEEAGIPPSIARPGNLRPAGVVSYEEAKRCDIDSKDGIDFFHTISRVVLYNNDQQVILCDSISIRLTLLIEHTWEMPSTRRQ